MNKVELTTRKFLNSFIGILIFIVSMSAFYLPYEIRIIPVVESNLPVIRMVMGAIVLAGFLLLFISRLRVFRDNWFLFAAIAFVGVLIFSTVMNRADIDSALGTYGLAGVFLIMTIAVFFKVNPKKYILIAFFLLLAVNIVNTYTVYHYWGVGMWEAYGLYRNTFFSLIGNYNGGLEYVLPMAICGSAYAHRYGRWLEFINYPAMIMSLMMAVKCDSMTQIMVYAVMLGFMLLADIAMLSKTLAKVFKYIFQPAVLWIFNFAAFISVIVLNKSDWLIRLGIDPDFHNRRHIWNMSMDWIRTYPLWGSGQESIGYEASKITGYAHSHCTYLETAYKTGFVGCVFMFLMLAAAAVVIYRNRNHRQAFIMSAMLFLTGWAMLVETYPMVTIMLCFGLIYYVCKNQSENNEWLIKPEKIRKKKNLEISMEEADLGSAVPGVSHILSKPESVNMPEDMAVEDTMENISRDIREETRKIMDEK